MIIIVRFLLFSFQLLYGHNCAGQTDNTASKQCKSTHRKVKTRGNRPKTKNIFTAMCSTKKDESSGHTLGVYSHRIHKKTFLIQKHIQKNGEINGKKKTPNTKVQRKVVNQHYDYEICEISMPCKLKLKRAQPDKKRKNVKTRSAQRKLGCVRDKASAPGTNTASPITGQVLLTRSNSLLPEDNVSPTMATLPNLHEASDPESESVPKETESSNGTPGMPVLTPISTSECESQQLSIPPVLSLVTPPWYPTDLLPVGSQGDTPETWNIKQMSVHGIESPSSNNPLGLPEKILYGPIGVPKFSSEPIPREEEADTAQDNNDTVTVHEEVNEEQDQDHLSISHNLPMEVDPAAPVSEVVRSDAELLVTEDLTAEEVVEEIAEVLTTENLKQEEVHEEQVQDLPSISQNLNTDRHFSDCLGLNIFDFYASSPTINQVAFQNDEAVMDDDDDIAEETIHVDSQNDKNISQQPIEEDQYGQNLNLMPVKNRSLGAQKSSVGTPIPSYKSKRKRDKISPKRDCQHNIKSVLNKNPRGKIKREKSNSEQVDHLRSKQSQRTTQPKRKMKVMQKQNKEARIRSGHCAGILRSKRQNWNYKSLNTCLDSLINNILEYYPKRHLKTLQNGTILPTSMPKTSDSNPGINSSVLFPRCGQDLPKRRLKKRRLFNEGTNFLYPDGFLILEND